MASAFGTLLGGGTVAAVFGAVYGAGVFFEKLQSRRNRQFVAFWLFAQGRFEFGSEWSAVLNELLVTLFAPQHFSRKCIMRCFVYSTGTAVLGIIGWNLHVAHHILTNSTGLSFHLWELRHLLIGGALVSFVVDYISLFKTRVILKFMRNMQSVSRLLLISVLDVSFTIVIWLSVYLATFMALTLFEIDWDHPTGFLAGLSFPIHAFIVETTQLDLIEATLRMTGFSFDFWTNLSFVISHLPATAASILQTPAFLEVSPAYLLLAIALLMSSWSWGYVLLAALIRALAHVPRFVHALRKIIDLDEHPIRGLGFVAAVITSGLLIFIQILASII